MKQTRKRVKIVSLLPPQKKMEKANIVEKI